MSERLAIPRRRLVNFRLTETEYDQLRAASAAHGRGISEFARNTILDALNDAGATPVASCAAEQSVMSWLDERFTTFEEAMHRRLLNALNMSGAPTGATDNFTPERNSDQ